MSSLEKCKSEVSEILSSAALEWNDIFDFVWKSDRIIKHERAVEDEKKKVYFPDPEKFESAILLRSALNEQRWRGTYPYMISSGNLFSVLSIFEVYLLQLAKATEEISAKDFSSAKGVGADKIFGYFKSAGISPESIEFYEQIKCAQKIRNCLMHAGGFLQLSKYQDSIREIVKSRAYLAPAARANSVAMHTEDLVSITMQFAGEKISIAHGYPHVLCHYLASYIRLLGHEIDRWAERHTGSCRVMHCDLVDTHSSASTDLGAEDR